jgi:hypothetical protein
MVAESACGIVCREYRYLSVPFTCTDSLDELDTVTSKPQHTLTRTTMKLRTSLFTLALMLMVFSAATAQEIVDFGSIRNGSRACPDRYAITDVDDHGYR